MTRKWLKPNIFPDFPRPPLAPPARETWATRLLSLSGYAPMVVVVVWVAAWLLGFVR